MSSIDRTFEVSGHSFFVTQVVVTLIKKTHRRYYREFTKFELIYLLCSMVELPLLSRVVSIFTEAGTGMANITFGAKPEPSA